MEQLEALNGENISKTTKKYSILLCDPPWKYGGRTYDNPEKRKPIEEYYRTMSFQELKSLDVQRIADDNCLLFLWVVSSALKQCIEVGESWGFKYITVGFVWHKKIALLGNYTMAGCEMCLIFKKGKIPEGKIKGRGNGVKQFLDFPVECHSKKPNEIRDRIKRLFPKSNRIELFARQKTEGWTSIGYDIDGKDIKQALIEINST